MKPSDLWRFAAAALFAVSAGAAETNAAADADEVIVADRVRGAFYEHAPRGLRREMQRAFAAACEAARREPIKDDDGNPLVIEPFCNEPAKIFLREVLVTGVRLSEGWVCSGDSLDRFRYFTQEMIGVTPCVKVNYDYAGRRMTVDLTWTSTG